MGMEKKGSRLSHVPIFYVAVSQTLISVPMEIQGAHGSLGGGPLHERTRDYGSK